MPGAKPDAAAIIAFLDRLHDEPWLVDPEQRRWPDYAFHFSDIENAVEILRQRRLLCRSRALAQHVLRNDHASEAVIRQTDATWQRYVRLYFRPRTPTFYDNEGFRPAGQLRYPDAHCRIPVAFLFNARALLTTEGVLFSDGSLARSETRVGDDVDFLQGLPFEQIYHDRAFDAGVDKTEIIRRRHAEVMVPDALPLEGFLSWIFLRSEAEQQTLRSLLDDEEVRIPEFWSSRIRVALPGNLFYRRWTFIERVVATHETIRIMFNPDSLTPSPFRVRVEMLDLGMRRVVASWTGDEFNTRSPVTVRVPDDIAASRVLFRVFLDGHLAHQHVIDLRGDTFVF